MNLEEFLKSDTAKEYSDVVKSFTSVEEAMNFAKEKDIKVTEDEVKKFISKNTSNYELSEDELDNVTGGALDISNSKPKCVICGGDLSCIDGYKEYHGCCLNAYNLYRCNNCGQEYEHNWHYDEWDYSD